MSLTTFLSPLEASLFLRRQLLGTYPIVPSLNALADAWAALCSGRIPAGGFFVNVKLATYDQKIPVERVCP